MIVHNYVDKHEYFVDEKVATSFTLCYDNDNNSTCVLLKIELNGKSNGISKCIPFDFLFFLGEMGNMSNSKKRTNTSMPWLYVQTRERFIPVDVSLYKHPAFIALTDKQKHVYQCMALHKTSGDQIRNLYKALREYGLDEDEAKQHSDSIYDSWFVFPGKAMGKFGLDRANTSRVIQGLVDAGFIKKRYTGHRKETVYQFVYDWKKLTEDKK